MQLPDLSITPKRLYDLLSGTTTSWLLITAAEFRLFNLTVEKKTAPEIATSLQSHAVNTTLFLDALCAMGLLAKEDGFYRNTELSSTFLVTGKECYLGELFLIAEQWNFQTRAELRDAIKNGPTPQPDISGDMEKMFAPHVQIMRNMARSGTSQLLSKEISKLPEFAAMGKMLDLGGAHGMDCIAITGSHPSLKGVVFDKPAVVAVTRKIIAEYDMEERVSTIGGNYAADPIGSDYDLIFAKSTLHFYKDTFQPLFTKIHAALKPGGIFVSVHDGHTEERTKPEDTVISWLPSRLKSGDKSLDRDTIPDAMLQAGFKTVKITPLPSSHGGSMDMCIGKKA